MKPDSRIVEGVPSPTPNSRASPAEAAGNAADAIAVFEHVSKWYGPVIGLNSVSLELRPGITGLVGPNGSGKSTLMKLAAGQLRPSQGRVTILGRPAWSAAARRHIGFCPETDAFYEEMSGRQFVVALARLSGFDRRDAEERAQWALARVGMDGRAERRLKGYSKGMRQRIKLAQALLHEPRLILLDEPLNGVDPVGRLELIQLFHELAAGHASILISSHLLEELERITDQIIVVARGRLAARGRVAEIRELLDNFPVAIRVDADNPRLLAAQLLQLPETLGVELDGPGRVVVRAQQPKRFFADFARLVAELDINVTRLETLDSSAQAILEYLLRDGR